MKPVAWDNLDKLRKPYRGRIIGWVIANRNGYASVSGIAVDHQNDLRTWNGIVDGQTMHTSRIVNLCIVDNQYIEVETQNSVYHLPLHE